MLSCLVGYLQLVVRVRPPGSVPVSGDRHSVSYSPVPGRRIRDRGTATATAVAEELAITRQAVTKHLATLNGAGLVNAERAGGEVRYQLRPAPLRLTAR
jgi:DNA-binding transcriptional ArsR family regulator